MESHQRVKEKIVGGEGRWVCEVLNSEVWVEEYSH